MLLVPVLYIFSNSGNSSNAWEAGRYGSTAVQQSIIGYVQLKACNWV